MVKALNSKDLRNICLNMLTDTLDRGKLSQYVLRETFSCVNPDASERAYIKRLFTGTLEKLVYLDHVLEQFSSVPLKKMKNVVRNILRMGLYQLKFMDSVPDYTVIDESVKLTRKRGFNNLCPFVNAVLRKCQREADDLELPDHVKALFPKWIYDIIVSQYGSERAGKYFESVSKDSDETFVRYNTGRAEPEHITAMLTEYGCSVRKTVIPGTRYPEFGISGFASLTDLQAFRKGLITVQDPSSAFSILNAADYIKENRLTLDVCAAPGGKSLLMAQLFPDAKVIARDLTQGKVKLINENIERLGAGNVSAQVWDALVTDENSIGKADAVIADLPCSGLGVVSKKPDILYRLKETDLKELADLQRRILSVVSQYVKPQGILIYSTCTVNRQENEDNTRWFTQNHSFELLKEQTLLKGEWEFDGFYYAYFRKN